MISLGLAGTNWLIDSAVAVRQAGGNAVERIRVSNFEILCNISSLELVYLMFIIFHNSV